MLPEEARWLHGQLRALAPADVYPMCDVGSSTHELRAVRQPWIDRYVLGLARERAGRVVHVDIKAAPGVDLVGDLGDRRFVERLRAMGFRSVLCCNLLEHVRDRERICAALRSIVAVGGYVIVTVPRRFPYHEDPIDTMFRPTIRHLAALFPGMTVHAAATVKASAYTYLLHRRPRALVHTAVRLGAPFYRPAHWSVAMRKMYWIVRGYRVTCLILRKEAAA